jgi:HPt (histidine-containing phosphotransfer) domain-containing protein
MAAGSPPPVSPGGTGAFDLSDVGLPPEETAALVLDVATAFRDSTPALVAALRAGAERGDAAAMARAAHTLKGACSNLRAPAAVAALAEVETLTRRGDVAAATPILPRVEAAHAELLREANAIVDAARR